MIDSPLAVLCDTHVIPILLFLSEHGDSRNTDIYGAVGRSTNLPRKLEAMEEAGLLRQEIRGSAVMVGLTDLGRDVVDALHGIGDMMSRDRN